MKTMKKTAIMAFCILSLAACGKADPAPSSAASSSTISSVVSTSPLIAAASGQELIDGLNSAGWKAQNGDLSLVDEWKNTPPKECVQAMTGDGMILLAGLFENEEEAKKAYGELQSEPGDNVFNQDEKGFQQETVNFSDDQGFLTIRQKKNWVTAVWFSTVAQQPAALAALDRI